MKGTRKREKPLGYSFEKATALRHKLTEPGGLRHQSSQPRQTGGDKNAFRPPFLPPPTSIPPHPSVMTCHGLSVVGNCPKRSNWPYRVSRRLSSSSSSSSSFFFWPTAWPIDFQPIIDVDFYSISLLRLRFGFPDDSSFSIYILLYVTVYQSLIPFVFLMFFFLFRKKKKENEAQRYSRARARPPFTNLFFLLPAINPFHCVVWAGSRCCVPTYAARLLRAQKRRILHR